MTAEDAQKDALQRVVERIRRLAEQRAARLENREQKFASQSVESMLQDVDVLTQIFSNDKKLRMWVESVIRIDRDGTIRLLDGAKHRAEVSDFWHSNSDGLLYLARALLAAFIIGVLAPKDSALQAELEKLHEKFDRRLKARRETAAAIKKRVWQMHDNGRSAQQIVGDLAKEKPPIKRSQSWVYDTIKKRSSSEF